MVLYRSFPLVCLVTAYLLFTSGCTTPDVFSANLFGASKSSADDAETPKGDHEELPPKEAARACLVAAEEMQNSGHVEQAIALYEKARSKDPGLKSVAHHLAVLYDAQGDSSRSLAEFNKAVESDPNNASLLSDLGYYYYERQKYAEAEQPLRKALAAEPNHTRALCNLGMVLAAVGRYDESFAAFSKAVGPAAAHSNIGVLQAKQGRYDEAKRSFHEALAIDPALRQPQAFLDYLNGNSKIAGSK